MPLADDGYDIAVDGYADFDSRLYVSGAPSIVADNDDDDGYCDAAPSICTTIVKTIQQHRDNRLVKGTLERPD